MNGVLPFVLVGLATGSVYGLAAMGLVLTYKTSGIFNFAHGAIAALAVYVYYDLRVKHGLPVAVAMVLVVFVLPPPVAFVLERITRVLAHGTATARIVATVGLQLAITNALLAHYGAAGLPFPSFLPTTTVKVFGTNIGVDNLIGAGIAAAAALGFYQFFKRSVMGVRMRAVVDNPELLGLAGTNAIAVRRWSWWISATFAVVSGLLLAPQIGLEALLLTLLVVQAYGAAAVGLFRSLPLTYAGGLVVGVLAALATKYSTQSRVLASLPPAIPFLVLFAVLLLVGKRRLVDAGQMVTAPAREPLVGRVTAGVIATGALGVGIVVPHVVGSKLPVYAEALVFVVILASMQLLVRISGQVSLAHAALVAVGSAAFSHLAVGVGLPWLLAVLLAGVVAVPVGMVVAIPSIRLSGLFLALATFGFGLLMERTAYLRHFMFGLNNTQPAPRPSPFSEDLPFYYVLLAFACGAMVLVAVIGHSRLGRLLRALSDAPTTLSTLGLGVNATRVTVFGISAFMAGIGGALFAAQANSATGAPFTSFTSLLWLSVLVMCGPARSAVPVVGALALAVLPAYINDATAVAWLPVAFGVGAVVAAWAEAAHVSACTDVLSERGSSSRATERLNAPGIVAERLKVVNRATGLDPVLAVSARVGSPTGGAR